VRKFCFYHAGCPDGFGAAWAAWRAWGKSGEYRPRGHHDVLQYEELVGAEVVFADIALPNGALRTLGEKAKHVAVLDHHVSALERFRSDPELALDLEERGHLVNFDLSQSGAVLAWNHFHPDDKLPRLLEYVQDQDLWHWRLPDSEAVNAAIGIYPRRFDVWDRLAAEPIDKLIAEGRPLVRAQRSEIERALQNAHSVWVGELRLEGVNALFHRSSIGHELAKRKAFGTQCGLVYRLTERRVDCSIYSIGDFDVASLAATFGGGGHRNAAGFSVTLEEWIARFV
jgi:oligoribonuclease NrnB/cAMP/cGMP phosphodiesterase (DHH superfamily)